MGSFKPTRLHRRMLGLVLFSLLWCSALMLASCSNQSASSTDTTLDSSVLGFYVQASWDEDYLTVERQTQEADLVVVGEVVQIDASVWNSPDGKEWQPPEELTLPIVYTTFYVKPTQVLKGEPKWGVPVAFRAVGAIVPPVVESEGVSTHLSIAVGQTLVVFGSLEDRYGPGGVYKPSEAYWLTMEENSIWAEDNGQFVNKGHTKHPAERSLPLTALESQISASVSSQP